MLSASRVLAQDRLVDVADLANDCLGAKDLGDPFPKPIRELPPPFGRLQKQGHRLRERFHI
jgi:hypothetical protein